MLAWVVPHWVSRCRPLGSAHSTPQYHWLWPDCAGWIRTACNLPVRAENLTMAVSLPDTPAAMEANRLDPSWVISGSPGLLSVEVRVLAGMSRREASGLVPPAAVSSRRTPERASRAVSCHSKARARSPAQDRESALPLAEVQVCVAPVGRVVTPMWPRTVPARPRRPSVTTPQRHSTTSGRQV